MYQQTHLPATPQPTRVRNGSVGRHPKPLDQLPKRTVKFQAYERQNNALADMVAAGVGKSEAEILRNLLDREEEALRASGVLKPRPAQETLAL